MKKLFICLTIMIFLVSIISADVSYCCEKTTAGAWCQNSPEGECNSNYRKIPTNCESTSFCKKGCCYNSQEGTCMENSPEKNCEDLGGVWADSPQCEVPQCELGCCVMGDQAAFVSLTRCKRLSSLYGLETDFRTDITNEMECIMSTTSSVKGACIFEEEFETTCLFITQAECLEMESDETSNVEFHPDYLCSDETFGTSCGPSEKTVCVEGRDEVYFVDTCGNLANIYDASKIKDKEYWSRVKGADETCGPGSSNANSRNCGNCNYYLGSTCRQYDRGETSRPQYGDYICKDLSCEYKKRNYEHGETWCAESKGITNVNQPGSRYFRLVCYDGEITVEPCADYRQEICLQDSINGFKTAACRVNMWQDCFSQNVSKDCENTDKRDCQWVKGNFRFSEGAITKGVCVPLYTPGNDFWSEESDTESLCALADETCTIKYIKKLTGGKKCEGENCECEKDSWIEGRNDELCIYLGDCGEKRNYMGMWGYNSDSE